MKAGCHKYIHKINSNFEKVLSLKITILNQQFSQFSFMTMKLWAIDSNVILEIDQH